jgi:hypothetical protein
VTIGLMRLSVWPYAERGPSYTPLTSANDDEALDPSPGSIGSALTTSRNGRITVQRSGSVARKHMYLCETYTVPDRDKKTKKRKEKKNKQRTNKQRAVCVSELTNVNL